MVEILVVLGILIALELAAWVLRGLYMGVEDGSLVFTVVYYIFLFLVFVFFYFVISTLSIIYQLLWLKEYAFAVSLGATALFVWLAVIRPVSRG